VSAPLTLGTAGHIDHGKTALVGALSGVDTDRLPEEKARGISIALGYAPLTLPSGRRLSIVDVPGHERFVRTMVAGATGIDLFLLVVAADDGVMPQTVEHAAVLAALGVDRGVVAVTKADVADPARAAAEARALLGDRADLDVVACSSRTGVGVAGVAAALDRAAAALPGRAAAPGGAGGALLHVDRSFTIRGAGTVVTGTLWSGAIARGDTLAVLPAARRVRVRGVEVHDEVVERAEAGQRVALNLVGVDRGDVAPGDVVAEPGAVAPTHILDAALALRGGAPRRRVHVHHGTRETPGRLVALGGDLWQARLERPLLARAGDHLVVRSIAPPDTLGGGVVLDPHARHHGAGAEVVARLERLRAGEATAQPPDQEPPVPAPAPPPLTPAALALEERLRAAGHEPPDEDGIGAPADLAALRAAGRAVRVGRAMYAHPEAIDEVRRRVVAIVEAEGAVTLGRLRDELRTSRKYAQALLEHLDAARVTRRLPDDSRVLRRAAR
jgi:selenocysteine-specific elongation factor